MRSRMRVLLLASDLVDAVFLDTLDWRMRISTLRALRVALCILSAFGGGAAFIMVASLADSLRGSAFHQGRLSVLLLAMLVELYAALVPALGLMAGGERDWLTHGPHASLCRTLDISQSSVVVAWVLPRATRRCLFSYAVCLSAATMLCARDMATPAWLAVLLLLPVLSSSVPVILAFRIACVGGRDFLLTWRRLVLSLVVPAVLGIASGLVVLLLRVDGAGIFPADIMPVFLSPHFELLFCLSCMLATGYALRSLMHYFKLLDGAGFGVTPSLSRFCGQVPDGVISFVFPIRALLGSSIAPRLARLLGGCLGLSLFLAIGAESLLHLTRDALSTGVPASGMAALLRYGGLVYSLGMADGVLRVIGPSSLLPSLRALWEWGCPARRVIFPVLVSWALVAVMFVAPLMVAASPFGVHPVGALSVGAGAVLGGALSEAAVGHEPPLAGMDSQTSGERGMSVAIFSFVLSTVVFLISSWSAWCAAIVGLFLYGGGVFLCLRRRILHRQLELSI